MCGITAYCGEKPASEILHDSLKRLEYRGYDSAGIATSSGEGLHIKKDSGEVEEIHEKLNLRDLEGTMGIGHTRWATHGGVSKRNAHPHTCCEGRFALVHNGIIENWEDLKGKLNGCSLESETDSEVIAHYIEERAKERNVEEAIREFMEEAEGSFAVTMLDSKKGRLFAFKNGSPLALGLKDGEVFVGSDAYAFSKHTNRALFLDDYEYATIKEGGFEVKSIDGETLEKEVKEVDWNHEESDRGEFEHHMHKEVLEIPEAIERLEKSLELEQEDGLDEFCDKLENKDRVIFTASGTSYHASLLGVYFLQKAGMEAQTLIASEFKNYERVDENTLLIPISQSGETKDVLEAMEYSRDRGAEIASITNVPHSTVERKSDVNLRIKAGQEVCVAATKTFTNQLYALMKLAERISGTDVETRISEEIKKVMNNNKKEIKKLAEEIKDEKDVYIIGKGETYPVAREMALKLKEIAYIHAEGMMGGELKHGTLALIEEGTPVISLVPKEGSEIVSNVKEVEAREGKTIKISPHCGRFEVPETENGNFAFFSSVLGFLLTYWTAREKELPIDKPRNLAKCVSTK